MLYSRYIGTPCHQLAGIITQTQAQLNLLIDYPYCNHMPCTDVPTQVEENKPIGSREPNRKDRTSHTTSDSHQYV